MSRGDDDGLGARFWISLVAIAIGIGVAAAVVLLVIGAAWAAWGFFGMFAVLAAVALGFGYWYDRRHPNERDYYGGRPPS
ncbi:MAG TPA: hypothetical protein VFD90_21775 [Gaiellales bacterium]|jgi:hypothetical protein|nr:hypothetical protein [Gaiellales bacterium]